MPQVVNKKVKLKLRGLDGNAFSLMGAFSGAARKAKWTQEETELVLNDLRLQSSRGYPRGSLRIKP